MILGADQYQKFSKWKDYNYLLNNVNLHVVVRPNYKINLNDNRVEFNDKIKPKNKSKMYKISSLARFSAFIRQIDFLKQILPNSILNVLRKIFIFTNKKNMKDWNYPELSNAHKQKLYKLFKNDVNKLEKYYPNISKIWNF